MSTAPINTSGIAAIGNQPAATTTTTKATDASGKDMFLKLLVEQLKNQDPMNPQDGAQFVAQLAQFNSVEQLIGINTKLDQLLAK